MIKLKDLIKENSNSTYKYGCVMLYFNFPEILKIHDAINPKHVYTEEEDKTFGLEDEPHTTLLYGLHPEVTLNNVEAALSGYTYAPCTVHNPSLFKNEKYDVLKFDVKGANLHKTSEALKQYPYTSDFPDYHPHLTIGYIQSGMGQKYVDMLNKAIPTSGYQLVPQYAVYSMSDGIKHKIKINVNGN
jgi:2'-5' RNA ligase